MKAGRVEGRDRVSLKRGIAGARTVARPFAVTEFTNLKGIATIKPDPPRAGQTKQKHSKKIDKYMIPAVDKVDNSSYFL